MAELWLKRTVWLQAIVAATQAGTGLTFVLRHYHVVKNPPEWIVPLHLYCGITFAAFIVLHVCLNWSWIRRTYFGGSA